jgi:hypothetical protein
MHPEMLGGLVSNASSCHWWAMTDSSSFSSMAPLMGRAVMVVVIVEFLWCVVVLLRRASNCGSLTDEFDQFKIRKILMFGSPCD